MDRGLGHNDSSAPNGALPDALRTETFEDALLMEPINVRHAQVPSSRRQAKTDHRPSFHTIAAARRLREARIAAGYATPKDFARAGQFNPTTYYHHENGRRTIKQEVARAYAKVLKLPAGTLLYGEHLQSPVPVPILGIIKTGGTIEMPNLKGEESAAHIQLLDPAELVGYRVQSDDLYPAFRAGDMVFHRRFGRFSGADVSLLHGLECIVQTAEGETLLRQVISQPDGRVTLTGYNVAPMFDVQLTNAAAVEMIRRAIPAHLTGVAAAA